jgi:hypothetical protein
VEDGYGLDWAEICAGLGYYTAFRDNLLPTFRDYLYIPYLNVKDYLDVLTLEGCTDRLSRNVGKELTLYAV